MKSRLLPLAFALAALLSTSSAYADVLIPDAAIPTDAGTGNDAGTAADGGTPVGTSSSSGGCSVAGHDSGLLSALMPLGLAALVPLALRRQSKRSQKR